jgi:hypothetical protein
LEIDRATIRMKVSGLTVDPFTHLPIVLLHNEDNGSPVLIPISVGLSEASAIATELDDIELERPMTHHLLGEVIAKLGGRVARVEISEADGGSYQARVCIHVGAEIVCQDARPSDALALALRTGAEIWVAADLVERATQEPNSAIWGDGTLPLWDADLADVGDEAFGKWKM